MSKPILLDELSHPQIQRLVDGGMDMVMLPVGAVEQHSLHLPLNVDFLIAQEIARATSALTGVPVLPALPYGHSSNHRGFHGIYSLRPETFQKIVEEMSDWFSTDESFGRCHANVAETSLMLHLRADLVDMSKTYPMPGKRVRPFWHYPHSMVPRDGHQGDPSKATAEMGKKMFDLAVTSLAQQVTASLTESAPDLGR